MHLLTSFIGAVGKLMNNTGLADKLSSGFADVTKMIIGKSFICMRAPQIVVEIMLALLIPNVTCHDEPMELL